MQCSRFLDGHREWQQVSLQNTAASAKRVLDDGDMAQAAIASKQAARNFGLTVLKERLNDLDNNFTRFVIISHKKYSRKMRIRSAYALRCLMRAVHCTIFLAILFLMV